MPEPLFLLSAPRSFSSVTGSILGQHPQTYGLPELNLFLGDTLGEAWNALGHVLPLGHDGILRTIAELVEGKQTEETIVSARQWTIKNAHWPTRKVFDFIQEAVGDKILVEKSPSLTLMPNALERMYSNFPQASFLHLVRHPRATGKSVLELHKNYGKRTGGRTLLDPEQLWLRCNQNAADFGATLPTGQYMRIKGEWLMTDPYTYLPQIAQWLDIDDGPDAIEEMLHPENSPYACVGPEGAPYGNDPNFLKNPNLDRERMQKISEPRLDDAIDWRPGEHFTRPVVKLANQFGYQ
ncbi:sulfotransferase [Actibacterium sp.]|uniref:sulfotransferase family protein n=1 Tax=Actibacterium sp. TaxID=1872125 RepID=UPI003562ED4F